MLSVIHPVFVLKYCMSQKQPNFFVSCTDFIMNSHQIFNHSYFKSFVSHRELFYSDAFRRAFAVSYRTVLIFNKKEPSQRPMKKDYAKYSREQACNHIAQITLRPNHRTKSGLPECEWRS